LPAGSTLFAG